MNRIPGPPLKILASMLSMACLAAASFALPMPTEDTLIVVSSNPDDAPILSRLPFEQLPARQLVPARAYAKSSAHLRDAVAASAGVFADLSQLSVGEMEHHPVFEAALDVGVPMVFVRTGDGLGLSKIVGLGLDTTEEEVVMVQAIAENKRLVHVVGELPIYEGDIETVTLDPETGELDLQVHETSAPSSRVVKADSERSADRVTSVLFDHGLLPELNGEAGRDATAKADTDPTCPTGSCVQWFYTADYGGVSGVTGQNLVSYTWPAISGTSQSPSLNIRYIITLYDSLNPQLKYLSFHTQGHINTNTMEWDSSTNRGYYNEDMFFVTQFHSYANGTPSETLSLSSTSPGNKTDDGATASTGGSLAIAANATNTGGGGTVTYTTTWDYRRPIANFHIADTSSPTYGLGRARWIYEMASSNGGTYNSWTDLLSWNFWGNGSIAGLPDIAKYNLQPATLSIWNVQRSFQDTARFRVKARQDVRRVWRSKDNNIWLNDEFSSQGYGAQPERYVWIDFGTVHQSTN